MPKRKGMKRRDVNSVSGKLLLTTGGDTVTQGIYVLSLTPTLQAVATPTGGALQALGIAKLTAESDVYEYFRFTRLAVRQLGAWVGNVATMNLFGYAPDAVVTIPTSADDIMLLPWSADTLIKTDTTGATCPSVPRVCSIPKNMLLEQNVKWWRTRVSAAVDDQFEQQGQVFLQTFTGSGSAKPTCWWELHYTCEFKNFLGANQTPLIPKEIRVFLNPVKSAVVEGDDDEKSDTSSVLVASSVTARNPRTKRV